MQEASATTKSQIAPHRYVPYHFKGLRPDQIETIKAEREGQVVQQGVNRKQENEEEYSWAVQNLANTQH